MLRFISLVIVITTMLYLLLFDKAEDANKKYVSNPCKYMISVFRDPTNQKYILDYADWALSDSHLKSIIGVNRQVYEFYGDLTDQLGFDWESLGLSIETAGMSLNESLNVKPSLGVTSFSILQGRNEFIIKKDAHSHLGIDLSEQEKLNKLTVLNERAFLYCGF